MATDASWKEIIKRNIIEGLKDVGRAFWRHRILPITLGASLVLLSFVPRVVESVGFPESTILWCWSVSLLAALPIEWMIIHSGFHGLEIRKLWVLFAGMIFFSFLLFFLNSFWFHGPIFREELPSIFIQAHLATSSAFVVFTLAIIFVVGIITFFESFLIGLLLFLIRIIAEVWRWLQRESTLAPFILKQSDIVESSVYHRCLYYATEIIIASFWFVLLLTTVFPIEELWLPSGTMLPIWLIIPLTPMVIIFDMELLNLSWHSKPINPKRFHKYWSLFAFLTFVIKIASMGLSAIYEFVFIMITCIPFQVGYAFAFLLTENASRSHSLASLRLFAKLYLKASTAQSPLVRVENR